jgi:hypothetical protein
MNSGSSSSSSSSSLQNITTWLGIEQIIDRVTLTTDSSGYASYTFTVGDDSSKDYLYYVVLDVLDDYYNYNNDTYYVPNSSSAVAFKTVMKVLRFEIELYKYVDGKWTYTKSYTGSGIYKLKATVRDFITFEKLSINNIHFGFNQSNSYYLMGKNSSVNGDVMFKFDASKYDIKDGNVTFWVWSPDIPSLGSIPKPINLTQSSSQGNTGNVPKIGYSESLGRRANLYKPDVGVEKLPRIELEVKESKAFHILVTVKLFDTKNKPMPNKRLLIKYELYAGSIPESIIMDPKLRGYPKLSEILHNRYTDSNGKYSFWINYTSPYIKLGTLLLYAYFDETYREGNLVISPPKISAEKIVYVGKRVTIYTDIDKILNSEFSLKFSNTTTKRKIDGLELTVYNFIAMVGKPVYEKIGNKIIKSIDPYITFNFVMELSPDHPNFTKMHERFYNFIKDSMSRSDEKARFLTIHNTELINLVYNNKDPLIEKYSENNALSRVMFKRAWQLRYPPWNFGEAIELYKKYILSFSYDPWLMFTLSFFNYPSWLQIEYGMKTADFTAFARFYSPTKLYSKTLTTGDYRYIAAAVRGSIIAIDESLRLGSNKTKFLTIDYLDRYKKADAATYSIITSIAAGLIVGAIVGGPWGLAAAAFVGVVMYLCGAEALVIGPEYNYLYDNVYSPKYLLNLVKLIEYDLTLLNYEINLWEQLKD